MGNCKIDGTYESSEMREEVNIEDNDNCLIKIYDGYNKKDNFKHNNNYINFKNNNHKNIENNDEMKNNILGKKLINLNMINSDNNSDDLVIVTPQINNNLNFENFTNEITDEYTIKNETIVYMNKGSEINENTNNRPNHKNIMEIKKQTKKIKNNNGMNNSKSKKKVNVNKLQKNMNKNKNNSCCQLNINNTKNNNISKAYDKGNTTKGRIIPNNNNLNYYIQNLPSVKYNDATNRNDKNGMIQNNKVFNDLNNSNQNSGNYLNKRKAKSKKNSKIFNKSYNNINFNNFGMNQLLDSFQLTEILQNNNPQSSTLERKNYAINNQLLNNVSIINTEEILPKIERKTYKEDLVLTTNENKDINNMKNSDIIYQLLNKNNLIKTEENININQINKINYGNELKNANINNIPIFKKKTDFHIRNKSYNKFEFYNNNNNFNNLTNDYNNDNNNYFSLFNNSTNLSINFIHNKYNKSCRNLKKLEPLSNTNKNNTNRNKSSCNQKVKMKVKNVCNQKDKKNINPFFEYKNFSKKQNPKNKVKNKSHLQKAKHGLSNSLSYNNIFEADNKNEFNTNSNSNNLKLSSVQYQDKIELYFPKLEKNSLIYNELINRIGNKISISYEKLDNINNEQILYDGIIYKVVDNIDNNEIEYKFLDRYFQISKNCFRYYNNINEAINEKDKPLVQFDIRHILNIEIFDNNFLGNFKINGNKNINILFCIYIKDNNDFFVFAHYNKYVGNNIINILQFLIRYYEDN